MEVSNAVSFRHDANYIALSRMLERYQNLILLTPTPDEKLKAKVASWQKKAQAELWSPLPYHRMKWLRSIEGARTLLLKLEQSAQGIKVQRTRREVVRDLAEKRMIIKRLRSRVEEIGREVDNSGRNGYRPQHEEEDPSSETMFDVLQQIRRSNKQQKEIDDTNGEVAREHSEDQSNQERKPSGQMDDEVRHQLFESSSNMRHRQGKAAIDAESTQGKTSGFSNLAETEKSLLASSAQHETITADLLRMAAQLKQQTMAFTFALDQDKSFVDRAVEGLEQNVTAMGIASKGMKTLQRMSEEQGFWGRLKLQLLIGGMWLVAIMLVFIGPKLRF